MDDWYCDEVLTGVRSIGIVAETPTVLAFHHTRPSYAAAHIVVIPKVHTPSLLTAEPRLLAELFDIVRAIAAGVEAEHGACRVVTNLGRYQDSKHLHWHVVSGDRIADPVEITAATWRPFTGAPPTPSAAFYASLPRRYVGAGALIASDAGDVLVVKPAYKAGWEFPGGVVEAGETPAAACARECREELGLDLDIGRLLVVDHQSIDGRGDSTMYIYEGPCLASDVELVLPGGEITEAKFVDPSQIQGLFPARVERRVRAALEAKSAGSTAELHGSFSRVAT